MHGLEMDGLAGSVGYLCVTCSARNKSFVVDSDLEHHGVM